MGTSHTKVLLPSPSLVDISTIKYKLVLKVVGLSY